MISPIHTFCTVYELDEKDVPISGTREVFIFEKDALSRQKNLENRNKKAVVMKMSVEGQ